eukprot:CAMPEP_0175129218 /NCGR_PEP_ID=MMETSP0087-20121206/5349_1 /TAXON_ID=136419 /ORGANISM="Unknown Unknown, Strain D1" /LENGTH=214 /DNA_ID=CAMNT_0016411341 /DNA_START=71 /DNA_END=712 /DNA_ORIENTATION=+
MWNKNLERRGGFFQNPDWYELQIERKLPLLVPMRQQMLYALPPILPGWKVCDLLCGSGLFSLEAFRAYPGMHLTLMDGDATRLQMASERFATALNPEKNQQVTTQRQLLDLGSGSTLSLLGAPFHVIVSTLGLHVLVGHHADSNKATAGYKILFDLLFCSLLPGGHFIFGDHVGLLPVYIQLKLMEEAGFRGVDVAWRDQDFFVAGGYKPDTGA